MKSLPTCRNRRGWLTALYVGLGVTVCVILLYLLQPRFIRQLDLAIYDGLLPLRAHSMPLPPPAIIDIDAQDIAYYGAWPWPRYLIAALVDHLRAMGVAAIGMDLPFSEYDRFSPAYMRAFLERVMAVEVTFKGLPEDMDDFDVYLAGALRSSPSVLGAFAGPADLKGPSAVPPAGVVLESKNPATLPFLPAIPRAEAALLPLPLFRREAPLGIANIVPDPDGVVRRAPLLWKVGAETYPSFALRVFMRALGTGTVLADFGPEGLTGLQVEDFYAPVASDSTLGIPFGDNRSAYLHINAGTILRNEVAPELLQGRIVLIGASAIGRTDNYLTPRVKSMPAVEIQAALLDALLNGTAIRTAAWEKTAQIAGIIIAGILAVPIFSLAGPLLCISIVVCLGYASVITAERLFSHGIFFSPLYWLITLFMLAVIILSLRSMRGLKQRRRLSRAFSRYVPPEIVQRAALENTPHSPGEERDLSILFTDIRGFTSISESLPPQKVADLLNRCFAPMIAIVKERAGTLDKFIGDALMAYWTTPLPSGRHAVLAVDAALSMHERLSSINDELLGEFGFRVMMGVGIHTGRAYVGNMGSDERLNYTLIGDNVNLASRIEGLCSVYGVSIVASEETMLSCGGVFPVQFLDTLRVKGRQSPISVFLPMRPEQYKDRKEEIDVWKTACTFYRKRRFKEAENELRALCRSVPGTRLYTEYLERVRMLQRQSPEAWDGIWTMEEK